MITKTKRKNDDLLKFEEQIIGKKSNESSSSKRSRRPSDKEEVTIKKTDSDASLNMLRPEILTNAMNQVNNNKGKAPMCYYRDKEDLVIENQEDKIEVQDLDVDNESDN